MSKFIWEITAQDLLEHAIWQFPHWKDETVISPASEADALNPNSDLLVKAKFSDTKGNKFFGYIKIASTGIENTQPCMFLMVKLLVFGLVFQSLTVVIYLNYIFQLKQYQSPYMACLLK